VSNIPEDNLIEPPMSVVGPAIEASKYYYEETHYKEMFSNLLATACDKSKSKQIHPAFVEIIKQLSPIDAKLFNMFKHYNTYPLADLQEIDQDGKITPFNISCFNFKDRNNDFTIEEHLSLTSSLDNIIRLGIVIKNRAVIELNYDYDNFRSHFLYSAYQANANLKIIRSRLELTDFGRNFILCC